jgi:hypothetical protein
MNETVAIGEFDLTKLFEEDDAAMSASYFLMQWSRFRECARSSGISRGC